jgi:NADH:ubiquinone oxidoreductase subunit 4 (subunit M)
LAGLLLKIGTGGYLRLLVFLKFGLDFYLFCVALLGMVFSCFFCVLQSDIKSLAAYSSINHMSFLLILLVFFSCSGTWGGVLVITSHGFISTLLFFFIGEIYHSSLTRIFYFRGGLFVFDLFFFFFFLFCLLFNRGVPLSLRFFGEFIGVGVGLFISFFFFFFLFFYFFLSFYYSVYLLICNSLSKHFLDLGGFILFFSYVLLFFNINLFLLFVFF